MANIERYIITNVVNKLKCIYKEYVADVNNVSSRTDITYNNNCLNGLEYCVTVCVKLLLEVCNQKYYPLISETQLQHIIEMNSVSALLNLFGPYAKDNSFIHKLQTNIAKQLSEYYAEECLLYIVSNDDNMFNQMLAYLNDVFANVI